MQVYHIRKSQMKLSCLNVGLCYRYVVKTQILFILLDFARVVCYYEFEQCSNGGNYG